MSTGSKSQLWAQVAVPVPVRIPLTYGVPQDLVDRAKVGARAMVAVGARRMTGIIVEVAPASGAAPAGLKPLLDVLDSSPLLSSELLTFVLRAADYYFFPPGEALRAALPPGMSTAERGGKLRAVKTEPAMVPCVKLADPLPGDPREALKRAPARARLLSRLPEDGSEIFLAELRRFHPRATQLTKLLAEQGWVELLKCPPPPDPMLSSPSERDVPPTLTGDQQRALEALEEALAAGEYHGYLLHGVTGSGKTEVYLRSIDRILRLGRSALVLVPEIALTPQLVSRFRARLGGQVAVLHSGLTQSQRLREWSRVKAGTAPVAIGARSAVFAPVQNLGIVVVDEEHDPSFKQDDGFRYNGRDLALLRAQRAGAVAVLGSATPSLETYHNTERGKLSLLSLPNRVTPRPLPKVEIVDMRRHRTGPGNQSLISGPLADELEHTLDLGHQAILFLNRRGYAPVAACESCGEPLRCPACSVALTFHQRTGLLECHYCAHGQGIPDKCPACEATEISLFGAGTERAEEIIEEVLGPRARVARLDSDVAPGRLSEAVLDKVRAGETNVLVGTQLVTKGHDLPGVSVVGVLLADGSLHFPDFRATERTFQLLTQVAGRAGRGEVEGKVYIQTYLPNHPAIRFASAHDYESFYKFEMEARRELSYPPLAQIAAIRLSSRKESQTREAARELATIASSQPEIRSGDVQILGPAPAPIAMIRGRYRYRILLKARTRPPMRRVITGLLDFAQKIKGRVRVNFDVDPVHLL